MTLVERPCPDPTPSAAPALAVQREASPLLRRIAGLSVMTYMTIRFGEDGVRASAYGADGEAVPVIERCRGDYWEPLASWASERLSTVDAERFAAECIAYLRTDEADKAIRASMEKAS